MNSKIDVSVCQMTSTEDVDSNLDQIKSLVQKALPSSLICFPENALFMRTQTGQELRAFELTDDIFKELSQLAQESQATIYLGALPLKEGTFTYNASVMLTPDGCILCPYKKIHLFDVEISNEKKFQESNVFKAGNEPVIYSHLGWRVGLSICYDLRFPALFDYFHRKQVDAISVPSSFLVHTGEHHWEVLLRARAIESQAYVFAAAQWGEHGERKTWGHSMIIGPWGEVIDELPGGVGVIKAQLDKTKIKEVRQVMPTHNHRKKFE